LKNQGLPPENDMLAAIPQTQALTTEVSDRLKDKDTLYLLSGFPGIFLKVEGDNVPRFFAKARFSPISIPVHNLWQAIRQGNYETEFQEAVESFTTIRIKQRLDKTLEIPPMPETAQKIINLSVDPQASINDLAKIVEFDPSLAAQLVSWAGSPYYNAPGGISSVHDAVVRVLGFDLVINLALGLALGKVMKLPTDGPRGGIPYWKQAVFTAALVEALAKRMECNERPSIGLAYLTGLLNNFGYLILSFVFPPHFSSIGRIMEANPHQVHSVIEQHVLGISREHICAWVMHLWDMPQEVVTALQWQQIPEYNGEHCVYSKLLFVANQLLRRMHHQESPIGDPIQPLSPSLLATLGLSTEAVEESLEYVVARKGDLMKMAENFGDG
jgi:HD-like signal output (HDOD) protein